MELLQRAHQQFVVAASCPWMGAWLCLMMQASHIPIDLNMLLEVKCRSKQVLCFLLSIFFYCKPMFLCEALCVCLVYEKCYINKVALPTTGLDSLMSAFIVLWAVNHVSMLCFEDSIL